MNPNQLSRMNNSMTDTYTKARFWKCALQVNPAGYIDYRGASHGLSEEQYNQELVDVAVVCLKASRSYMHNK